jgi:hypothetical protein
MKNLKKVFGIMALIAIFATALAPQAQAKKKRDPKKEAIEDLLREGTKCYEDSNFVEAAQYFEEAHKKGNIRATHNLAMCYDNGNGVVQNYTQAFKLYEKAAKKGYVNSQYAMGAMYMEGRGVQKDYKKAIKWFEKAAKQNDSDSMYEIGRIYYYGGHGVKKDKVKAKQWIAKSAALNNEVAKETLEQLQ